MNPDDKSKDAVDVAKSKDIVKVEELPISFQAKYMGTEPARGLWGIRHTRKPVDAMVQRARSLPPGVVLPIMTITVSTSGITLRLIPHNNKKDNKPSEIVHPIDTISYGVQDMVYTRVFSIIVVKDVDAKSESPFDCHAFVCDSRNTVRKLTYALAAAFEDYSRKMKERGDVKPKKFAIDLRTPEEMEADENDETEA